MSRPTRRTASYGLTSSALPFWSIAVVVEALAAGRRYAIVGVFVVAAVVTPPDPISQTMLALPIILLYEISIWCVRLIEKRRRLEDEEADRDIVPV